MSNYYYGDKGQAVEDLQTALNQAGYGPMRVDGDYGPTTERLVKELQKACGLIVDGEAGPKTQAALGIDLAPNDQPNLKWTPSVRAAWERYKDLIVDECFEMDIDEPTALAIIAVESAGRGLTNSEEPMPTIRFENHLFKKYIPSELFARHFRFDPSERWKGHEYRLTDRQGWKKVHIGTQEGEYAALALAISLDTEGAYKSISMGAGQILGSWHERLGFAKPSDMFQAFKDEGEQIRSLFRFIRTGSNKHRNPDGDLWEAAKEKRWYDFARQYNGPGQPLTYKGYLKGAHDAAVAVLG
jgi:hypothetical protein